MADLYAGFGVIGVRVRFDNVVTGDVKVRD